MIYMISAVILFFEHFRFPKLLELAVLKLIVSIVERITKCIKNYFWKGLKESSESLLKCKTLYQFFETNLLFF